MIKVNIKYVIAIVLMAILAVSGVFSSASGVKGKLKDLGEDLSNIIVPGPVYLRLEPSDKNNVKIIRACSDSKFARCNPGVSFDPTITRLDTALIFYVREQADFPKHIKIQALDPSTEIDVRLVEVDTLSIVAHPGVDVRYRESRFVSIDTVENKVFYNISPYLKTRYVPKRFPEKPGFY